MKRRKNKKDETNPKEDFFEGLENVSLKLIIYIILAFVVFITGKFFWWAGFVLYIILAVYMLSEILINGFVFIVGVFLAVTYLYSKLKNVHLKSEEDIYYLLLSNLLLGIFCSFLLILVSLLFVFFFR